MEYSLEIDIEAQLNNIANEIDSYSQTIYLILQLCDDFNITKPASPSINFRDAINHYVILYEKYEIKELIQFISQISSISEHLNRGIKDAIIHILSNINLKLEAIINNPQYTKKNLQIELRKHFHIFKKLILDIRLGSIDIERLDNNKIITEIKNDIIKMKSFLESHNLFPVFLKRYYIN
jgi:hypothetical protein